MLSLLTSEPAPILCLREAVQYAANNSPDIQKAQALWARRQELEAQAQARYLPDVRLEGDYTRNAQQISVPSPNPAAPPVVLVPANGWHAKASLRQALVAPELWPAIDNARLAGRQEACVAQSVRRQTLLAVAQRYYAAVSAQEKVALQREALQQAQHHEHDAQVRFDAGAAPRHDLLRAAMDRLRAEQGVQRQSNAHRDALSQLAALLNREANFDVVAPPILKAPESSPSALHTALQERPDSRAAQLGVNLADGARRQAALSYLPDLSAYAQYEVRNAAAIGGRSNPAFGLLLLSFKVWDGGLRESMWRDARAQQDYAQAQWRYVQAHIQDDVRRAQFNLESAWVVQQKAEERAQLARTYNDLATRNYEAGASGYLEVTDAHATWVQAESERISEALQAQLSVLLLAYALGVEQPLYAAAGT